MTGAQLFRFLRRDEPVSCSTNSVLFSTPSFHLTSSFGASPGVWWPLTEIIDESGMVMFDGSQGMLSSSPTSETYSLFLLRVPTGRLTSFSAPWT